MIQLSSKNKDSLGRFVKLVGIVIAAVAALVVIAVIFVLVRFSQDSSHKRNALADQYNILKLPGYLTFTSRKAEGDNIDSYPYWYYYYTTSMDTVTTANDLQSILMHGGYVVGQVENKADITTQNQQTFNHANDPVTTDYEFDATNQARQLRLIVRIDQSKKVTVTVQKENQ
jgi:hypothetical protein